MINLSHISILIGAHKASAYVFFSLFFFFFFHCCLCLLVLLCVYEKYHHHNDNPSFYLIGLDGTVTKVHSTFTSYELTEPSDWELEH